MNKLVSIIVPIYNSERYIERTIVSILNQSYKDIELLLINDGSTDDTINILNSYAKKDSRIVLINKENEGVSATRNIGLDKCKGNLVTFVDADDYVDGTMIEQLVTLLETHDSDISCCGNLLERPDKTIPIHGTNVLMNLNRKEALIELIIGKNIEPSVCSKLFKKEIVYDIRFDKDIKYNEDYLFNLYAFKKAKRITFLDKPLYHYNLHANSSTTAALNIKRVSDCIKVSEIAISIFEKNKYENIHLILEQKKLLGYLGQYNVFIGSNKENEIILQKEIRKIILKNNKEYKKINMGIKNRFYFYGIYYMPYFYRLIYMILKFILPDRRIHKI